MLDKYFYCSSRSGGVSKDPTYCLMRVWLAMAELHLDRGDLQAADECAMEARTLTPHAYQVTVTRALIQEACGHTEAARHLFEDALAVNPFNSDNIAHLARIYFRQGHHRYDYERSFSQYTLWRSIWKARWGVAEWIERPLLMLEVRGSNPGHSASKNTTSLPRNPRGTH